MDNNLIYKNNLVTAIKDITKVDWIDISYNQSLSEDFIREFKDKVDWNNISAYQTLSENFIREFKDKVNWDCISFNQKLSLDFIYEFENRLCMDYLFKKNRVTKQQLDDIRERETVYSRFEMLDL